MRVRWSRRALKDLKEIGSYIASDKPEAARRWVERLRQRAKRAGDYPLAGRRVPEIDVEDLREVLVGSYRIVYRLRTDALEILTVFEGHRLLPTENLDLPEEE